MVKNGFSLASYSSLASFFLFMESSLKGQAVYEDIEPDLLIQFDNQSVELDMDNDGSLDFIFLKQNGLIVPFQVIPFIERRFGRTHPVRV